jgi:DNA-binding NarL/FixJ family response regulator
VAAEGGVSAATLARQAAEVAASQHQPAVEVLALHTAVCFGDRTVADRLTQLAAQAAGARAHRLAQACDGARTPALATLATPLSLTDREREIVTLAASGLSNRQIAQRLVVSVRTVAGHFYHASTKLGASNRTDLTTLLHGD